MAGFRSFVIIAEMRSGSNLLESSLAAFRGVRCHGELFNPNFVGQPERHEAFGIDFSGRERDPGSLLEAMAASGPALHGFRWFHDHDARVPGLVVGDPTCAIIRLTRNPVDCYVSLKIAQATGQWRLGNLRDRKAARVWFDSREFDEYVHVRATFDAEFEHRLQTSGRTAFRIGYDQLPDLRVLNGLAAWLGIEARLDVLPKGPVRQNPGALEEKVENYAEMVEALRGAGPVTEVAGTPRGPAVREYLAGARTPLLFQPIPGGPTARVAKWLEGLDGAVPLSGFRQKSLREWQAANPAHRAFTVVRHPLLRAAHLFRDHVVAPDGSLSAIRSLLAARYGVTPTWEGFEAFLTFVEGNLAGQTSVRENPIWDPQLTRIGGFSLFRPPDAIVREEDMAAALPALAPGGPAPAQSPEDDTLRVALASVLSPRIERIAGRIWRRDYLAFGYEARPSGGL